MNIHAILKERFGFDQFRAGQEAVINDVISGRDTIAILPTGSGKSLCYQLPAYTKSGTTLIISPLVALMEDQVAFMKKTGEKRVVALNSFLSYADRRRIIGQLDSYKFIFISPEMLLQNIVSEQIKDIAISLIVVDEAHCISQWGFDFRPDYLRLGELFSQLNRPNVLALTATADDQVLKDIIHYLRLNKTAIHKHSLDRKNISYSILEMNSEHEKTAWIIDRARNTVGPGIIYVGSRRRANEISALLIENGVSAASYHAGLEQEDRAFIQEQYINGEIDWISATNAFGMGIHKSDVRQVIHENVPGSIAGYTQEVGRAGRDGEQSAATLLFTSEDIRKTRFIIQGDMPQESEVRYFYELLEKQVPDKEAAQLAGLSETGKRVTEYYLERMSLEAVISSLEEQSREKERKLQQMLQIIKAEKCIRESVLFFFGETIEHVPSSCCSVCRNIEDNWIFDTKTSGSARLLMGWSERLEQLLG